MTEENALILLIDDDPQSLRVMGFALNEAGFRVAAANGGAVAFEVLQRVQPDLILCDVIMPDLSGYEVCRRLKADPATAATGKQAQAQLDAVHPIVAAVCSGASAAPAVDASSIQALVSTGLPALAHLAGSLPLPAAQQAEVQAALVVAETAAGVVGVVEQQINAAKSAPASTASSAKP